MILIATIQIWLKAKEDGQLELRCKLNQVNRIYLQFKKKPKAV